MSFSPWPVSLEMRAARWVALPFCSLVDLGCGEGEVARWMRSLGLDIFGLDRSPLACGPHLNIQGDALRPPIREGRLDGLVAANLVPHALAQDPSGVFFERWLGLLNSEGWVFLLGDHASEDRSPDERNYQELQAFLARLMPGIRGPLVSGERVYQGLEKAGARNLGCGIQENSHQLDKDSVLDLLAGTGRRTEEGQAARLARSIRRHGISPGKYWWVEAQAPATT